MYSANFSDIEPTIVLLQILMNVACVVSVQSTRKEGCVGKMNSKSIVSWIQSGDSAQAYNTAVTVVCEHVCGVCVVLSLIC